MPVEIDPRNPKTPKIWDERESETLKLLYSNKSKGYRPWEIADRTTITRNDAHNAVARLHKRDMVGLNPDGYFFALNDPQIIDVVND